MRILKFAPYLPPHPGGLETHIWQWSQSASDSGDDILMITTHFCQESLGYHRVSDHLSVYVAPSLEFVPLYPCYRIFWAQWSALRDVIVAFAPEIIHTHTRFFLTSLFGSWARQLTGAKWVHIEHGSAPVSGHAWWINLIGKGVDATIGRYVLQSADQVLAVSRAAARYISGRFPAITPQVIYRGIQLPLRDPDRSWRWEDQIIKIGCIARLVWWKNIDGIIRAIALLPDTVRSRVSVEIIGEWVERANLQALLSENIPVRLLGNFTYSENWQIERTWDIYLHASHPGGGLATSLLEGMHFWCAIVATPYEGANEVVVSDTNGILLADSTPQDIANGIEICLKNRDKWPSWARYNADLIDTQFTWDGCVLHYRKAHAMLLSDN